MGQLSSIGRLERLINEYDADLKFEVGTATAWSGELRLTLTDPPSEPSRSVTFFSSGCGSAEEVAAFLLADAETWLSEGGQPMPPPTWMVE